MKQFIKRRLKSGFPYARNCLPTFLDDWLIPGIPLRRRCVYTYMRYIHAKEYLLSLTGLWDPKYNHVPHILKRKIVKYYANKYNIRVFVETGTYLGDMISALSKDFDEIHSVELFRPLYDKACLRFATLKNIHLYFGDSSTEIATILDKIKRPALFWLDAHYSGKGTARGHDDSPILGEINKIFEYGMMNHVILIDDASDFKEDNGYPEITAFKKYIAENRPDYSISLSNNIIVLEPKGLK